jgi:hypothetical protein
VLSQHGFGGQQPPAKKGRLTAIKEAEKGNRRDISVMNLSTGSIWLEDEDDNGEEEQQRDYCFRASTKRASMANASLNKGDLKTPASRFAANKKGGAGGKMVEKNGRWSRLNELVASTPNATPRDMYMVER